MQGEKFENAYIEYRGYSICTEEKENLPISRWEARATKIILEKKFSLWGYNYLSSWGKNEEHAIEKLKARINNHLESLESS
ncbi:MAG: hypothetical protein RMY28_011955 [Nostoc sp. ChiSLP01]|nr:hypothetical protein [Nostoc sp. CmiSLP01]MDZ8289257.1 hypothetical protein [Nostoc sp. ChiSLP01]